MPAVFEPAGRRLRLAGLLLVAFVLGITMTLIPGGAPPASHAAEHGNFVWFGGWPIGSFQLANGAFVYCVEPGTSEPSGAQHGPAEVAELPGYTGQQTDATGWSAPVTSGPASGATLRQINYLLASYGSTTDLDTAAVVQLAIWLLRGDPGAAAWLQHHLDWVRSHGGETYVVHAAQLAAEARTRALPAETTAPGSLVIDGTGTGQSTVSYPAGTTRLRISGGVFETGQRQLDVAPESGGTVGWRAEPHSTGWQRSNEVVIDGEWSALRRGWPDRLVLHPAVIPSQQGLASGVGPVEETREGGFEPVRTRLDAQFEPVLSTRTPEGLVARGTGSFTDTVTFAVTDGSAPWASRTDHAGATEYAPVVAEGVVYGPFSRPPVPAAEPPVGAPIAGRARVVAAHGPGDYEVASDTRPSQSGYYSWVWTITGSSQPAEVREADLIAADYRTSDAFGLSPEGQSVPTALRWSTRLLHTVLSPDRLELQDRVTAEPVHGVWLQDDEGDPLPARLRLTVYRSDAEPVRAQAPPAGAHEIARSFVTVTGPGVPVDSEAIGLPARTSGWVTVQTCLLAEDQPAASRGRIEEWCDDYGIPEETARISVPTAPSAAELARTGANTAPHGALGAAALAGGALLLGGSLLGSSMRRRSLPGGNRRP